MNSKLSESPLNTLCDSRIEAIRGILSENEESVSCFKLIDDRLNELHKIVPKESRKALYEIEMTINRIVSIANELTYKRGFQEGMGLMKLPKTSRRPQYMIIEFESKRKDAYGIYKWTSIYKILRFVKEYTSEEEADQDLTRLINGEATEDDILRRRKRKIG